MMPTTANAVLQAGGSESGTGDGPTGAAVPTPARSPRFSTGCLRCAGPELLSPGQVVAGEAPAGGLAAAVSRQAREGAGRSWCPSRSSSPA